MYIPGTTMFAHSSCTSLFIFINPQYTVLHILSHCTFYSLFYFILLFVPIFILFVPIFIYILLCYVSLFYFFCTVHWADLSWLTFHYWLYPVWLCMWRIIKNLEPWREEKRREEKRREEKRREEKRREEKRREEKRRKEKEKDWTKWNQVACFKPQLKDPQSG